VTARLAAEVVQELSRRAERFGPRPDRERHDEATVPVAVFPSGGDRYAVPLGSLRAALPLRVVTPVPLAPAHVVGVLRFRGRLITAVSLGALLGVRGWQQDPAVLLVVQLGRERLVAVDCEQIPTPAVLPARLLEEARARSRGPVTTITTEDLERLQVLDLARLLEPHGQEGGHGR